MRRALGSAFLGALLLLAGPALAHDKRADACGCHNQYGLRHCHQKKKTERCEAPVKTRATAKPKKAAL